jgi:hypothetical protein
LDAQASNDYIFPFLYIIVRLGRSKNGAAYSLRLGNCIRAASSWLLRTSALRQERQDIARYENLGHPFWTNWGY